MNYLSWRLYGKKFEEELVARECSQDPGRKHNPQKSSEQPLWLLHSFQRLEIPAKLFQLLCNWEHII